MQDLQDGPLRLFLQQGLRVPDAVAVHEIEEMHAGAAVQQFRHLARQHGDLIGKAVGDNGPFGPDIIYAGLSGKPKGKGFWGGLKDAFGGGKKKEAKPKDEA